VLHVTAMVFPVLIACAPVIRVYGCPQVDWSSPISCLNHRLNLRERSTAPEVDVLRCLRPLRGVLNSGLTNVTV